MEVDYAACLTYGIEMPCVECASVGSFMKKKLM